MRARISARAAIAAIKIATLEGKLASYAHPLERRYRPDQPRAPRGTAIGGQWVSDVGAIATATSHGTRVADLASDLIDLGGGMPTLKRTSKGVTQFIFPNGMVLRFDLEPGQYKRGQALHINIEFPGRPKEHIDLR
jgi:hypothetical protein